MATQSGLVRSFYGWLARVERSLRESGNEIHSQLLPAQRPTSLAPVTQVAQNALRALQETPHVTKAQYWAKLFTGINRDGWKGPLRQEDRDRALIRRRIGEACG